MPWGVAAAAAVGLYGASQQAGAAKDAANAQTNAANQADATQLQMYNQTRSDQAPFRQAGLTGLNQYMNMLGLGGQQPQYGQTASGTYNGQQVGQNLVTMQNGVPTYNTQLYNSDPAYAKAWNSVLGQQQNTYHQGYGPTSNPDAIQSAISKLYTPPSASSGSPGTAGYETGTPINLGGSSNPSVSGSQAQQDAFAAFRAAPGYQFGLDQGNRAVQASAAARGGLNSGATLKALTQYGQNYADQNGYTPYMNRLASLSGMAQTSANTTGVLGQNTANQIGNNQVNAGQAAAGGIYGSANAWSNFGNQAAGALGQYAAQNNFGGV